MFKPGNKGVSRLLNAVKYSWKGFCAAWTHEEAFRQEVALCIVLVPLGLWLGDTGVERALLLFSALTIPLAELFNSAIEAVVDRFGGELHPLSGRAKDIGSASVFLSVVIAVAVWGLVLL
jgi:diacylglycerol kinase (ATP)